MGGGDGTAVVAEEAEAAAAAVATDAGATSTPRRAHRASVCKRWPSAHTAMRSCPRIATARFAFGIPRRRDHSARRSRCTKAGWVTSGRSPTALMARASSPEAGTRRCACSPRGTVSRFWRRSRVTQATSSASYSARTAARSHRPAKTGRSDSGTVRAAIRSASSRRIPSPFTRSASVRAATTSSR